MNSHSKKFIFAVAWDNDGLYPETEKPYVYDLRSAAEFSIGSVAGASNIQPSSLVKGNALFKANESDCIVLICKTGTTSSKSAGDLKKQGYTNVNVLSGGMTNWTQSGLPLVKN